MSRPGKDGYTMRERAFLRLYTDPTSETYFEGTASALKAYNCANKNVAASTASRVLKKYELLNRDNPDVKIDTTLTMPLNKDVIINGIRQEAETAKNSSDRLRAWE